MLVGQRRALTQVAYVTLRYCVTEFLLALLVDSVALFADSADFRILVPQRPYGIRPRASPRNRPRLGVMFGLIITPGTGEM